jgi:NitT/TauT family transport system substrate-binding protein
MDYSFGGDGIVATSDIQKLEGLYGKTVALARDDVGESFISFLFHKYGLSLDKLTFVAKRPQEVAQAFLIGEVDAVVTWEPWLSQALERSASHILVSSKEESGVIIDTLNIREDIIKNNPALVKGLMRGWFKAVEYCQEHPQEASEIIAGHYNLTAEEYRKQLEGLRWLDYRGQLSQERYNSWVDVFNTVAEIKFLNGRISKKPDAQSALNQELLKGLYPAFAEDPPPTAGLDECEERTAWRDVTEWVCSTDNVGRDNPHRFASQSGGGQYRYPGHARGDVFHFGAGRIWDLFRI